MKTVQSLDDLHRFALGKGAEVIRDGGKRFNASLARVPEAPKPKPVEVAPVVAPPPPAVAAPLSVSEVNTMLAARDQVWVRQLETVIGAFKAALSAKTPGAAPTEWTFHVTYLPDGEIETVHAKAGPTIG